MRLATLAALIVLAGCSWLDLPDQARAEALSPNQQLVARAWCLNGCDIAHRRHLTIQTASAATGERMPPEAELLTFYLTEAEEMHTELRWRDNGTLEITGKCLADDDGKPVSDGAYDGFNIRFVRQPTEHPC